MSELDKYVEPLRRAFEIDKEDIPHHEEQLQVIEQVIEQKLNPDDIQLKAEREVVERIFSTKTIGDSVIAQREVEVRKLAASLFLTYFDVEERDEVLFGPGLNALPGVVEEYVNKADKIYEFAGDYETAKKIICFLQIVEPNLSKSVVDSL
jgi:hypothetical protein